MKTALPDAAGALADYTLTGRGRAAPHHRTGDPGRRRDAGPEILRRAR